MQQEEYKMIEEIYRKRQAIAKMRLTTSVKELVDLRETSSYVIEEFEKRIEDLHTRLIGYDHELKNYLDSLKEKMEKKHGDASKFNSILEDYAKLLIQESN